MCVLVYVCVYLCACMCVCLGVGEGGGGGGGSVIYNWRVWFIQYYRRLWHVHISR